MTTVLSHSHNVPLMSSDEVMNLTKSVVGVATLPADIAGGGSLDNVDVTGLERNVEGMVDA